MGKSAGILGMVLLGAVGGCSTWGTVDGYQWTLKAPSKVSHGPGDKLVFVVETTTPRGEYADGISYIWIVNWIDVRGVDHEGVSYGKQMIDVQGNPGTAMLRIYAYDKAGRLAEVAKAPIQVE